MLTSRLLGPGAFRLFLALVVYVNHISSLQIGVAAVYIFFALSGYWIEQLWSRKYQKTQYPYVIFLTSRYWRLLPVFLTCSFLAAVVAHGLRTNIPSPEMSTSEFVSSIAILGYSWLDFRPLGPAWSLDIEMQFYLLAPLMILLLNRSVTGTLVAVIVLGSVSWIYLGNKCVLTYLPLFLAGVCASRFEWKVGFGIAALTTVVIFWLLIILALMPPQLQILLGGAHLGETFQQYNGYLNFLLAVAALPLALYSVHLKSSKVDRAFGELSYAFYLVHWVVLQAVFRLFPDYSSLPHSQRALALLAVTLAVTVSSLLLWALIDHPLNQLRSRFVDRQLMRRPQATH
jgi:peptidoglycan/LPS O-acetylase OafA/YrhL